MRHLAAFLLLAVGGNATPSAEEITNVLSQAGIESDPERLTALLAELDGKDINEIGMEYSVILGSIKRAAEALEAGGAREVAIQAEHLTTIIRVLNDEYFLALTMRPDGNPGKGRFVLRTAAPRLLSELS